MAKSRKVILFLVEGPTDESALVGPFEALWKSTPSVFGVKSEAFHCDVTTVHLYDHDDVDFTVKDRVLENVHSLIQSRIDRKHAYDWKDLAQIIHVVDLDGAFVPSSCIRQASSAGACYGNDFIEATNVSDMVRRNRVKSASLRKLVGTAVVRGGRREIPYSVYFVSRNLEHALYGISRDLTDAEKERLSIAFGAKYAHDPEGFAKLLSSADVRVPGKGYADTWKYVQQGTNSLKRGSNLHLLINGFDTTGLA